MVSDNLRASCELLVWKCRQDGKTIGDFATDHIDIAVTYPHVGVQTASIVLGRAVVKHRRNTSSGVALIAQQDLVESTARAMALAPQWW